MTVHEFQTSRSVVANPQGHAEGSHKPFVSGYLTNPQNWGSRVGGERGSDWLFFRFDGFYEGKIGKRTCYEES